MRTLNNEDIISDFIGLGVVSADGFGTVFAVGFGILFAAGFGSVSCWIWHIICCSIL
jgi:hypothetical protein